MLWSSNSKTEFGFTEGRVYYFAWQWRLQPTNGSENCKPAWGIKAEGFYRKIQDRGGFDRNLVHAASWVGHVFKVVS